MSDHDWSLERKMLTRWAYWRLHSDSNALMRECGLSWAGSPPSIMRELWASGAATKEDVGGYPSESPPQPDYTSQQVDEFMAALAAIEPASYRALLARHARIVGGERLRVRSESWVAQSLYGLQQSGAWKRLTVDCEAGYAALRRWRSATSNNGNNVLVSTPW